MPFKKNDPQSKEWQSMGGKAQVANRNRAIDLLWDNWREGFSDKYDNLMHKLLTGEELTKSEKEFCDRYEKNLEFVTPKLARKEVDVTSKGEQIGVIVLPEEKS